MTYVVKQVKSFSSYHNLLSYSMVILSLNTCYHNINFEKATKKRRKGTRSSRRKRSSPARLSGHKNRRMGTGSISKKFEYKPVPIRRKTYPESLEREGGFRRLERVPFRRPSFEIHFVFFVNAFPFRKALFSHFFQKMNTS